MRVRIGVLFLLTGFLLGMAVAAARASSPLHLRMWLCIHEQERTPWTDRGWPYWGGLQMGEWFLSTYAHPPGMPHQWTPRVQMRVAENAWKRERYSIRWLRGQWPPSVGVCF